MNKLVLKISVLIVLSLISNVAYAAEVMEIDPVDEKIKANLHCFNIESCKYRVMNRRAAKRLEKQVCEMRITKYSFPKHNSYRKKGRVDKVIHIPVEPLGPNQDVYEYCVRPCSIAEAKMESYNAGEDGKYEETLDGQRPCKWL